MDKPTPYQILSKFFFEVGTLRKIPRMHRQTLFTHDDSDNIGSHSHRVSVIGYFLAQMENVDVTKVITMCIFHDIEESRTGDQNWVHKKYLKNFNEELFNDQIKPLPNNTDLVTALEEYEKRESKESIVAKDADLLDQVLLLKEYARAGNKEAELWLESKKSDTYVKTKSAKKLLKEILKANPGDWWYSVGTSKRR